MKRVEEVTRDLRTALESADARDAFYSLPSSDQERFMRWIVKANDDEAYWRRIDILVLAMRMAPPAKPSNQVPPAAPGVLG